MPPLDLQPVTLDLQPLDLQPVQDQRTMGDKVFDATQPYIGTDPAAVLGAGAHALGQAGDFVKKAALPTIGTIGGTMLGALAAPFTGPAAPAMPIVGGSMGSAGGEWLNQKLGITEPSTAGLVGAAAAPGIGAGAMGLGRLGMGTVAKVFGGRPVVGDAAGKVAEKMLRPAVSSEARLGELAAAKAAGAKVPTGGALNTARDVLDNEIGNLPEPQKEAIEKIVGQQAQFLFSNNGRLMGVGNVHAGSRRLGKMIGDAHRSGDSDVGDALSRVRNALIADADNAGIPALKQFNASWKREAAIEDLQGIMMNANPLAQFQKKMANDGLFRDAFKTDGPRIEALLKKLSTVTPSGGAGVVGRTVSGAVGGAVGGPAGAVAGAIAPDITAAALSTRAGQEFLERLLVGNVWNAPRAAALAAFVRGKMAEAPQ
jgi:hypothetical protein